MENEKLSKSFIQKYEPLSDSFVVVENHIHSNNMEEKRKPIFSFFKIRTRENVNALHDEGQSQTQPETNSVVILSRDAYNKSRILKTLYQNLALSIPQCEREFNELTSEMAVIESTLLSIYQTLSGNNFVPEQTLSPVELTGNIQTDIDSAKSLLQDLTNDVLSLQRSVNVQNIDRQLAIISTTLVSQANRLNNLNTGESHAE